MNVQRLTLDLNKSSVPRGRVTIAQCDHDGTTVEAEIYDNGAALDTSGLSAYLVMRLPDGRHYYRAPATLDGHVATALMDEAYAATVVGTTEIAYFELVGSGEVVYSTSRFAVRVLPSATAGATVPETWDGEVERLIQQLDDAIETATDAANVANAAAANADATVDDVESRVQEMAQDAAETATADAEQRIQDAIDAMGDISELAVPLMSADVRGGAKLDEHGGLVLRDEKLGIGSLVQESDGTVRGGIAELTAKGHAEQDGTPTPDNPVPIQVVRGRNLLDESADLWEQGTINSANGSDSLAANRIKTIGYARVKPGNTYSYSVISKTSNPYYLMLFAYKDDGTFVATDSTVSSWQSSGVFTPNIATRIRVVMRYANDAVITTTALADSQIQLTLGSTPTPYVPYGHVGLEVQGKNLLDYAAWRGTSVSRGTAVWENDGVTLTATEDDCYTIGGFSENARVAVSEGQTITMSWEADTNSNGIIYIFPNGLTTGAVSKNNSTAKSLTYTAGAGVTFVSFRFGVSTAGTTIRYSNIQIELNDHATDFEPYYHTTTPIPLPSRGWVAGLPDGTADSLRLDGAGKCEWELADAETTTAATDGVTGTIGVDVLSTTGQIADGATVLYKLATPATEDCGYINMPSIEGDCTISIPELDALGVRYFVDDSAGTLARQWYERAQSEYEGRISALEQAVAELVTA